MMERYTRIDGQEYEAKIEIPVHAASKSEQSGGFLKYLGPGLLVLRSSTSPPQKR